MIVYMFLRLNFFFLVRWPVCKINLPFMQRQDLNNCPENYSYISKLSV